MKLTTEQIIDICNRINTAIAEGKMVVAGDIVIAGVFPNCGNICAIRHYDWNDMSRVPIFWLKDEDVRAFDCTYGDSKVICMPIKWINDSTADEHGIIDQSVKPAIVGIGRLPKNFES